MTDSQTASIYAAIPAAVNTTVGLAQQAQARKRLRNLRDPGFDIPISATEALSLARTQAGTSEMPGMSSILDRINQVAGQGYNQANLYSTSAPQALGAMQNIAGQQMNAILDVEGQNAAWKQSRIDAYMDALNTYADWQNRDQEYNQNKFLREAAAISGLAGAGLSNTVKGIGDASGVAANYYKGKADHDADMQLLQTLYGNAGGTKMTDANQEQIDEYKKMLEIMRRVENYETMNQG